MMIIERAELKADPIWNKLMHVILRNHTTPSHTVKNLLNLRHIKNVCEETTKFVVVGDKEDGEFFISYDFATWIQPDEDPIRFPTRIERVRIFEDFVEYESTRVREISAAPPEGRDKSPLPEN